MTQDAKTVASWVNRSVLVTGATGLVGGWLVQALLQRGATVTMLAHEIDAHSQLVRSGDVHRIRHVYGVAENIASVERALSLGEADTVFHLGAQTLVGVARRSPYLTFEANVRGTYSVLEACRRAGTVSRILVASSDKAYGESVELPYTEETPLKGLNPYEASKTCTDVLAQSYARSYQMPIAIARCGNIYGGGDLNWSRIIPGTIRCALEGTPPIIRSDGNYVREYIHVDDVVAAYLAMSSFIDDGGEPGEAFNFTTGQAHSVREVVATITSLAERADLVPVILNQATGEIRDQRLSSEKAQRLLNWNHTVSLREGLTKTMAWYREFLEQ